MSLPHSPLQMDRGNKDQPSPFTIASIQTPLILDHQLNSLYPILPLSNLPSSSATCSNSLHPIFPHPSHLLRFSVQISLTLGYLLHNFHPSFPHLQSSAPKSQFNSIQTSLILGHLLHSRQDDIFILGSLLHSLYTIFCLRHSAL
jgi:hypothetical protein